MRISQRKFMGIPVRTRSGVRLGKLSDFIIESDTGRLEFLVVRVRGLIGGLMQEELRIPWAQVVSLNEREAVVVDAVVPVGAKGMALGISES